MMKTSRTLLIIVLLLAIALGGVLAFEYFRQPMEHLRLATTTSTYDSGLLDYLTPIFETKHTVKVDVVSVGTGQAIEIARRGDADMVLVHAKELEESFVRDGYGVHRVGVMYNDFVIIGPMSDPAGINGMMNATEAFMKVAESGAEGKAVFISRADKSGTNLLELKIWARTGIHPSNSTYVWYWEAGASMGTVLRMANEKQAYTLTDRGTWLSFKRQLINLTVLAENDEILLNPYGAIPVNPEKHPQRNFRMAVAFVKFLISEEGQKLIADFKKKGETLFMPLARNFKLAHALGFLNQEQEVAWYDAQTTFSVMNFSHSSNPVLEGFFKAMELIISLNPEVLSITLLSLRVSGTAVLLGSIVGVPLGAFLGLRGFRGKRPLLSLINVLSRNIVNTFMGLPPVVVGLTVYLLLSASGPLGPLQLLYTPTAMILAQLIMVIPIITGVTMSAVGSVDKAIRERALSLGATEWQTALIVLTEARMGLLTAIVAAFGAAISEVGGIMIVGGNIRWSTRVLTTAIVYETELGEFGVAIALGIILLSLAFVVNLALTYLQLKGVRR